MTAIVRSERDITPQQRLAAGLARGRRPGRLPGGHVIDLADLKKAITLCDTCITKFNAKAHDYTTKSNLPFVRGRCDGCGNMSQRAHLLVHSSLANLG